VLRENLSRCFRSSMLVDDVIAEVVHSQYASSLWWAR
jgi:hypothetical protein